MVWGRPENVLEGSLPDCLKQAAVENIPAVVAEGVVTARARVTGHGIVRLSRRSEAVTKQWDTWVFVGPITPITASSGRSC